MSPQTGRFQPADRLRRSVEFQQVIRRGRRVAGGAFVVICAQRRERPGAARQIRLGITVSRKVGNAVVRNRVKRRIREWFRADRGSLGAGVDLVVIGRAAAAALEPQAFCAELTKLSSAAVRGARQTGAA
jgi:ribonuclease P protein component